MNEAFSFDSAIGSITLYCTEAGISQVNLGVLISN